MKVYTRLVASIFLKLSDWMTLRSFLDDRGPVTKEEALSSLSSSAVFASFTSLVAFVVSILEIEIKTTRSFFKIRLVILYTYLIPISIYVLFTILLFYDGLVNFLVYIIYFLCQLPYTCSPVMTISE